MKRLVIAVFAASALSAAPNLAAQTLNFENIALSYPFLGSVPVLGFYNGGTSAVGTSGPNYGVQFSSNAEALCLNTLTVQCGAGSRGGVGDPNSQTSALFFYSGTAAYMNRSAGMVNAINFKYVALNDGGTAWAWSGLNGTGTMLGALVLPGTPFGRCDDAYNAFFFCPFDDATLSFTGVARSIVFTGVADAAAMDDITFQPFVAVVPEPGTLGLAAIGLFGMIVANRKRRRMAGAASRLPAA